MGGRSGRAQRWQGVSGTDDAGSRESGTVSLRLHQTASLSTLGNLDLPTPRCFHILQITTMAHSGGFYVPGTALGIISVNSYYKCLHHWPWHGGGVFLFIFIEIQFTQHAIPHFKVCNSHAQLSMFTALDHHQHHPIPERLHHPKQKPCR